MDLSINTEVAVKKGLELADENTVIHLLHVQTDSFAARAKASVRYRKADPLPEHDLVQTRLNQWKWTIEESAYPVTVCTWTSHEHSVQKAIEKKSKQLRVDLVIIGKNSHHSWFPFLNTVVPSVIAKKTGIAVLTVKPGSIYNKIRTAVVPIGREATKDKMELMASICRKYKLKIHLVTFINRENKPDDFNASALLQVYQWLKNSLHCPVEYAVLHGHNKAKAILDYTKAINADILLVHPETETKIGWPNKQISDVLPPASKVQVLAVQSAPSV